MNETNKLINLKTSLWKMACNLRGNMDAFEFKDYILGLLCFRFLSEKLEKYLKEEEIEDYEKEYQDSDCQKLLKEKLSFYLKPEELWSHFIYLIQNKKEDFNYKLLMNAFASIEETSKNTNYRDVFNNLFSIIDLDNNKIGKTTSDKNDLLSNLMRKIDNLCPYESFCSDYLGDIYEYLIGEFAASAGKKAGEFFTPIAVSALMAEMVTSNQVLNPSTSNLKIYDPTCGSGSLLLQVVRKIKSKNNIVKNAKNSIIICGQELNDTTYNLARMNMLMHAIDYFEIKLYLGNTLTNFFQSEEHPHREIVEKEGGFSIIVANPPYSQTWRQDSVNQSVLFQTDERFSGYGGLAPKNKADWAFVQHMIYCLKDEGVCAVVLPHGILFRENAEGLIRKHILEKGYIDAVIGLPEKIFYGTSIATCILIIRKCKKDNNVLFIDASQEYSPGKQNTLSENNIQNILKLYLDRKKINSLSYVASIEEIKQNNYDLSINHYITSETKEENIDIVEIEKNIITLENQKKAIEKEINNYLKELREK
ncbi:type I restriction-modification system subunit M [Candidatus Phytoplasma ziziphi]|uniref:site-specific DNA-methyltransferase (adenine-specific) n=1 Tax=Ziziphus jujuba witches'-broom phytoplasma TaxID=135727 RepID=A0A660HNL4_ZIZJU|nr:type I restriction-modification system subunit M [Candidatus Phytoplasma ziziphi]AYJ01376.1 type I restriction-modification system subunit M [Candidatus Phytoplasma ziziphi]